MKSQSPRLMPLRGLSGAIACALAGATSSVLLALGFTLIRWLLSGASELDLWDDLRWLSWMMIAPVIGCAAYCGCAGWATFAPVGHHRFAGTLAIIALFSLSISMMFVPALPQGHQGGPEPVLSLPTAAIVFGPLIAVTSALTVGRAFRSLKPCPIPG